MIAGRAFMLAVTGYRRKAPPERGHFDSRRIGDTLVSAGIESEGKNRQGRQ